MPSLGRVRPDDRHFTLDRETGTRTFGNGEHGRRPAAGSLIEATYRCGSGRSGNRAWLALAVGAALAGFLAAFLSHGVRDARRGSTGGGCSTTSTFASPTWRRAGRSTPPRSTPWDWRSSMEGPGFFAADELFVSTRRAHGRAPPRVQARDRETVHRFHEAVLAAGGTRQRRPGRAELSPGLLLGLRARPGRQQRRGRLPRAERGARRNRSSSSRPEPRGRPARHLRPGLGPALGLPADGRRDRRRAARGRALRERGRLRPLARAPDAGGDVHGRRGHVRARHRRRDARARPGESVVIPPRDPHGFRRAPGSSRLLVTVRPALALDDYFRAYLGLSRDRRIRLPASGLPRGAPPDRARHGPLRAGDRGAGDPARPAAEGLGGARRARPEAGPEGRPSPSTAPCPS